MPTQRLYGFHTTLWAVLHFLFDAAANAALLLYHVAYKVTGCATSRTLNLIQTSTYLQQSDLCAVLPSGRLRTHVGDLRLVLPPLRSAGCRAVWAGRRDCARHCGEGGGGGRLQVAAAPQVLLEVAGPADLEAADLTGQNIQPCGRRTGFRRSRAATGLRGLRVRMLQI